jgi:hypothetical protein
MTGETSLPGSSKWYRRRGQELNLKMSPRHENILLDPVKGALWLWEMSLNYWGRGKVTTRSIQEGGQKRCDDVSRGWSDVTPSFEGRGRGQSQGLQAASRR